MSPSLRPIRVAVAAVGAFAVLFVVGGLTGWWTPAANEPAIGEVSRWCERVAGGILREPVNTLGNLGFVFVGLTMLIILARDTALVRDTAVALETASSGNARAQQANRFIGNQPVALTYAGAAIFLGPGSMVMHGSHTFFGAWIDNVSMVAYILIPWMVNVATMRRWSDRRLLSGYAIVLAAYAVLYWLFGPDLGIGMDLFGLSIALWTISEVLYRFWSPPMRWLSGLMGFAVALVFGITPGDMLADIANFWWVVFFWLPGALANTAPTGRRSYTPWFWLGMASFLVAFAIWNTGKADHPWCRPDSLIQAHAIWHLLTAFSTWSFFLFLRTERSLRV